MFVKKRKCGGIDKEGGKSYDRPGMVNLSEIELNRDAREWVENVLQEGEMLLWAGKPMATLKEGKSVAYILGGLVEFLLITALVVFLCNGRDQDAQLHLFMALWVPGLAVGLLLAGVPFLWRRRDRQTVYLLTDRRAVVLQPSLLLSKKQQKDYMLHAGLIKDVVIRKDGSGDMVMDYKEIRGKYGVHRIAQGFLKVPQVQQLADKVKEAVAQRVAQTDSVPPVPVQGKAVPVWKTAIMASAMLLGGIVLLAVGAWQGMETYDFLQRGVRVEATVVQLARVDGTSRRGRRTVNFAPVVRYKAGARTYTVKSAHSSNPPAYSRGEKVQVYYMPDKPDRMVIDDFLSLYTTPLVLLGAALVVLLGGFYLLALAIRQRKMDRKQEGSRA